MIMKESNEQDRLGRESKKTLAANRNSMGHGGRGQSASGPEDDVQKAINREA